MQEFNIFKVDEDKKKKGVWVDHPSGRFLIGSPDPLELTKAIEASVRIVQKKHSTKKDPQGLDYKMPSSEQILCNARVVAQLQLLGWEIDGVKYTKKAAIEALIADREYSQALEIEDLDEDLDEDEGSDEGSDEDELEVEKKPVYQSLLAFITEESNRFSNYEKLSKEEDVKK